MTLSKEYKKEAVMLSSRVNAQRFFIMMLQIFSQLSYYLEIKIIFLKLFRAEERFNYWATAGLCF